MPKVFDSRLSPADAKRRFGTLKPGEELRAGLDRSHGHYDVLVTLFLRNGQSVSYGSYMRNGNVRVITYGLDAIAPLVGVDATREPTADKADGTTPRDWAIQWGEHKKLVDAAAQARVDAARAEGEAKRQEAFARGEEILVLSGYKGQLFDTKDGFVAVLTPSGTRVPVCCTREGGRRIDNRRRGLTISGHSPGCHQAPPEPPSTPSTP